MAFSIVIIGVWLTWVILVAAVSKFLTDLGRKIENNE
jgi:hypothetical protein